MADLAFSKKMLEWDKKKHLGLETKKEYTFRELVDWYLELPKVKMKKSYIQDKIRSVVLKDRFGNCMAHEIKPSMIESFQYVQLETKCRMRENNYSPASVNRTVATMKRIYSLAVREDFVDKNPCLKVSMLAENNKRDQVITKEQYESLISNLPEHAARIVVTAYYTGMRFGEIINLTWDKVNLKDGYINLKSSDTKTKEPRQIPLNRIMCSLFTEIKKVRHVKHNHVFTYEGNPIKSIKRSFSKAREVSGIQNFHFHDLRHTFNTNMRKAGVDRSVIMKITGHKSIQMFERYNTVDSKETHSAIERLDEFLNKPMADKVSTAILLQEQKMAISGDVTS